jgi:hypothetical protein
VNDDTLFRLKNILLPVLRGYCDQGWPGLSVRMRNEATNALWDLRVECEDTEEQ